MRPAEMTLPSRPIKIVHLCNPVVHQQPPQNNMPLSSCSRTSLKLMRNSNGSNDGVINSSSSFRDEPQVVERFRRCELSKLLNHSSSVTRNEDSSSTVAHYDTRHLPPSPPQTPTPPETPSLPPPPQQQKLSRISTATYLRQSYSNSKINPFQNYYAVQHKQKHAQSGKKYPCERCGKLFVKKNDVQKHIAIVHDRIKDFECVLCKRKFGRKDYLVVSYAEKMDVFT